MEEKSALFSLAIDPSTKSHLAETARWARFLAIAGFVFLLLMVLVGIYSSIMISRFEDSYRTSLGMTGIMSSAGVSLAVVYLLMAVVAFFPLLFALRFANLMRDALQGNDQGLLNASFQNLKICFRFLGIVTIISLVLVVLSLVFGFAGLALSS